MAFILKLVLYGFIANTYASPLSTLQPSQAPNIIPRQHTDDRLSYIKRTYPGIYWDEAVKCGGDNFNILAEATRMLAPFTDTAPLQRSRFSEHPAWNRFFVNDKKAKKGYGWHVSINSPCSGRASW